jgi:NhaP-type Na+/H+ or K+/H+ antiporter
LGIAAQWLAWRLRLPSILMLLAVGFLAGPVIGLLDPDTLLGDLISPIVTLSVGIIIFEGGLSLKLNELRAIGRVVRNLLTIGVVITWGLGTLGAHFLLGLDWSLSLLLGAILVVTGPTVIVPLLRDIRPSGRVSSILRWEGIMIDPIGVTLALLVFEGILAVDVQTATQVAVVGFVKTVLIGVVFGVLGAFLLTGLLRRYWIPDYLENPVTVMIVIAAFALSDLLQPESGLLTATVMGIVVANQRAVSVRRIIEFKENLGVMLISTLFILLAARLHLNDLVHIGLGTILFVIMMMLVVRPLAVLISTLRSDLKWQERLFIAWLAPRGIVAMAAASIFTLELEHIGHPQAELLTPLVFTVIVATVVIYGLTAGPVARRLGVAQAAPQGVLIVGAHAWARKLAAALQDLGFKVLLVDSNWENVQAAHMEGLEAQYSDVLTEHEDGLNLTGLGRLLALTSNDEVNSLAALHFAEVFGRAEVYQLPCQIKPRSGAVPQYLRGRLLFRRDISYGMLDEYLSDGAEIKATPLTAEFTYEDFQEYYQGRALPLAIIDENHKITFYATDQPPVPRPGHTLLSLINRQTQVGLSALAQAAAVD